LHFLPNIVWVIKSGGRLAEHVAGMGEIGTACRILVGKPEGNNNVWLRKRRLENDRTDGLEEMQRGCGVG
jgi:hypothetical protein